MRSRLPALAVLSLGTKNFTEAFLIGELYRQAFRSSSINVKLVASRHVT